MKYQKVLALLLCLLCVGCKFEKLDNNNPLFKEEYEKYNGEYLEIELEDAKLVQYRATNEINELLNNGTGVIYIGSPTDNLSRKVIDLLLEAADNTSLEEINYIDHLDDLVGLEEVSDKKIPLVLFVLNGKIVNYHVGTIDDKIELSDEEIITLYNLYLEGIHQVLQDACDERC